MAQSSASSLPALSARPGEGLELSALAEPTVTWTQASSAPPCRGSGVRCALHLLGPYLEAGLLAQTVPLPSLRVPSWTHGLPGHLLTSSLSLYLCTGVSCSPLGAPGPRPRWYLGGEPEPSWPVPLRLQTPGALELGIRLPQPPSPAPSPGAGLSGPRCPPGTWVSPRGSTLRVGVGDPWLRAQGCASCPSTSGCSSISGCSAKTTAARLPPGPWPSRPLCG